MPAAASAALRAAVHTALTADAALIAALGGPKIYDEPPREAAFPYVTLGETRLADFSAGGDAGLEHQLTLHAWSRQCRACMRASRLSRAAFPIGARPFT